MIPDFKTYIGESLFGSMTDKGRGEIIKKEDGAKVHTCLGVDIILKNPNCDYNGLIHDIVVGGDNEYEFGIQKLNDMPYTPDEKVNVMKFKAPYDYLIYEGGHGTDLVATFSSYSEILEFNLDDDFEDEYCEEDYISICRGIATKVKEIGDCFDYVHYGKTSAIGDDKKPNDKKTDTYKYEGGFVLELISETDVFYWSIDNDDNLTESLNHFKDDIIYEFPELEDTDFLYWNYNNNGGCFIAIPAYNINNLLNIRKYREFTKKWFKS